MKGKKEKEIKKERKTKESKEWKERMRDKTNATRQVQFQVTQSNNYKIGNNINTNRLSYLNIVFLM